MWKSSRIPILGLIAGLLVGYFVFHPYTMLVYIITHIHPSGELHLHWYELMSKSFDAFRPMMIPMAVPFILFGGVAGLLLGILAERKKKIYAQKLENEKRQVALETLQKLMVTLSHYLLNANMIIGGKVRHCRKLTTNHEILNVLEIIEQQGRKIDAVISTLREITKVKTVDYTIDNQMQMIDIANEIEERLK